MNITLLCNRDLASNLALNRLLPRLSKEHQIRVFLSDRVGAQAQGPADLAQLKFYEQTLFNELLFPAIDAGPGSGELLSFQGLGRYTVSAPASLNRVNSEESLEVLASTDPDLIISIRYGGILREQAIAIPRLGVINLHSGLLPDYRGVMATFRALLAGESNIGCTLHYIRDAGIDTGDIITTTSLAVDPSRSYLWHVLALYGDGCDAILECTDLLARGETPSTSEQGSGGSYFSFPDEHDIANFRGSGFSLYDAAEITAVARRFLGATQ